MSDSLRTRGGAVALVAAPALVLAAHLLQATPSRHDTASELASIAAHPDRYQASQAVGVLSLVLFVPAFLSMARPLWRTSPRLAVTGVSMSVAGLVALALLMGSGPLSLAMTELPAADRAEMVALTDRYEGSLLVGVCALLMVVGYSLGPVVLGVGLWRAGFPAAVPLLLLGGVVLAALDAGRWPLAAGFALTTAGMGLVALRLWSTAGGRPALEVTGEHQGLAV